MKNSIAFIFNDDSVKFVSSYSYISNYEKINNNKVNPLHIKVNLIDDINEGCKWNENYQVDCAYDNLKGILDINNSIKSILKVNSKVYERYMKIKNLKEKCQQEKTNT